MCYLDFELRVFITDWKCIAAETKKGCLSDNPTFGFIKCFEWYSVISICIQYTKCISHSQIQTLNSLNDKLWQPFHLHLLRILPVLL